MLRLFSNRQSDSLTGIVPASSGTAIASITRHGNRQPLLQACDFAVSTGDTTTPFAELHTQTLDRQCCTMLLPTGDYQLLAVDAPEVPPEEMSAAIRWRIQDMIDYHIDDAVVDIFDAPPAGPANSKQLYVVVARTDTVRKRIDDLELAGISLEIIDIPELAMRNIAACLPEDEAGLVSLYFGENQCLITITHNAILYLTRSIDIGYRDLHEQASSPQALCNRIALEIQRSMDYYEHNYHQAAVRSIVIYPVPVEIYGLTDALQQTLGLQARTINVDDILPGAEKPEASHAAECLLAVGSALRTEQVTL